MSRSYATRGSTMPANNKENGLMSPIAKVHESFGSPWGFASPRSTRNVRAPLSPVNRCLFATPLGPEGAMKSPQRRSTAHVRFDMGSPNRLPRSGAVASRVGGPRPLLASPRAARPATASSMSKPTATVPKSSMAAPKTTVHTPSPIVSTISAIGTSLFHKCQQQPRAVAIVIVAMLMYAFVLPSSDTSGASMAATEMASQDSSPNAPAAAVEHPWTQFENAGPAVVDGTSQWLVYARGMLYSFDKPDSTYPTKVFNVVDVMLQVDDMDGCIKFGGGTNTHSLCFESSCVANAWVDIMFM